jgi:soluble lytic murein transglycosylase-like protein
VGALGGIWLAGALTFAGPVEAAPIDRWRPLIEQASVRFGIPARWIEQVMAAESRGLPSVGGRPIRSRAGAIGLMQLMPATWATMRARLGLGDNPDDPRDNILAGSFYLRLMYDRFGYPGLFAAYNAGPARYARAAATGTPLPEETRIYLSTVTGGIAQPEKVPPASLFAVRHEPAEAPVTPPERPSIFAVCKSVP